ncbi:MULTISPECIES: hypothetical protein [Aphanothece]|uniref:hypothetical protein n=1 Tax=Aphanothece TaxID=1121 RepID=UPI00398E9F5C
MGIGSYNIGRYMNPRVAPRHPVLGWLSVDRADHGAGWDICHEHGTANCPEAKAAALAWLASRANRPCYRPQVEDHIQKLRKEAGQIRQSHAAVIERIEAIEAEADQLAAAVTDLPSELP